MTDKNDAPGFSRRGFLRSSATGAALPLIGSAVVETKAAEDSYKSSPLVPVTLMVNGQKQELALDPRTSLLDALREHIGLTGSKKGCDHGQCGACTVHVDGKSVNSCLTLALSVQGNAITTIEGLAKADGSLHPMQQAFVDYDAFQCGYCTSGQIMSAVACVTAGHAGSEGEIREFMSGNLCRCAAYPNIVAAVVDAKTKMGA
ncbi:(2Fe-2S)-binding protein [Beijerinckia sp. L45]|uniref:(2Fe-2S)-binding protein n=1 Tax=Beijerinckia sp. L45 TaxID=1641855 RepID=UPI00131C43E1|nr:(2Fe-2S)-binding protein [Beijerinckia sp. L45]